MSVCVVCVLYARVWLTRTCPVFPPVAVQCVVGLHWGRWVQLERGVVLVNDQHESWSGCVRQPSGWHLHEHEHAAITGAWSKRSERQGTCCCKTKCTLADLLVMVID